jgi:hypothetical protein
MDDDGTERKVFRLPTALDLPRERLRVTPPAQSDFVSQLIAERQHLPPQRERRRAPVVEAVNAYDRGARIAARRMPAGYRKTIVT